MLKKSIFISLFSFVSLASFSQTEDPKVFVKNWIKAHPDVCIISQANYDTYSDDKKAQFNALPHKFICQTLPTKEEILLYEKSNTSTNTEQNLDKQ